MSGTYEPLVYQATAVLIGHRALMIEGPSGSGKSALALSLIDRRATLIGDDGVTLQARSDTLIASPPPTTKGLIEIRNVGIASISVSQGPVALLLALDENAPRFVENAPCIDLCGYRIPKLAFDPTIPAAAVRAEWALKLHGLPLGRK